MLRALFTIPVSCSFGVRADHGDPEHSGLWPAITGQIRALRATHWSFSYETD